MRNWRGSAWSQKFVDVEARDDEVFSQYIQRLIDPSLTWEAVDWLRSVTRLPVLLKGVLAAADAKRAVDHGVAGIVVSAGCPSARQVPRELVLLLP